MKKKKAKKKNKTTKKMKKKKKSSSFTMDCTVQSTVKDGAVLVIV